MKDNVIPFPVKDTPVDQMLSSIARVIENQLEFQSLAGIPILSTELETKLALTEGMLLKLVEEIVEFRKTMPSNFNKFEKNRAVLMPERAKAEYCDMVLFMINLALIWGYTFPEILSQLSYVQANNFAKIREKIRQRAIDDAAREQKGGELPFEE